MKKAAVIGCGLSGILSARCLLEEDIEPTCFDKNVYIGGLWQYTEDRTPDGPACVWKGLRTNGSRYNHLISDFPDEENYTEEYPSHESLLAYMRRYAKKHDLEKYMRLNHEVLSVQPDGTGWKVEYRHDDTTSGEKFDFVIVATGRFSKPIHLDTPGIEKFKGVYKHANSFKHANVEEVIGKTVLVVGNSFSAGDIADFAGETAKQVYLSIGKGCGLYGRLVDDPNPIPSEMPLFARCNCYSKDPLGTFDRVLSSIAELSMPDQEKYNIGFEGEHLSLCGTIINETLPKRLRDGKVIVKRHLTEITENGAKFDDGSEVKVDTIWAATGYEINFPFLSKDIIADSASTMEVYKFTWPLTTAAPTLAFVGSTINGIVPGVTLFELQARWVTQVFAGNVKLPSREVMEEEIKTRREMALTFFGKDRGKPAGPAMLLCDSFADEIGALPKWWQYVLTDPWLTYSLWYGNPHAAQYRIRGPHKWAQARDLHMRLYFDYCRRKGDSWNVRRAVWSLLTGTVVAGLGWAGAAYFGYMQNGIHD